MHLIYFMRVFIIASVAQLTWINCASAFTCYDATGNTLNSGAVTATANVYVNLPAECSGRAKLGCRPFVFYFLS